MNVETTTSTKAVAAKVTASRGAVERAMIRAATSIRPPPAHRYHSNRHRDRCDQCAQPALSYNSCRDRHCPKCLTAARNAWVAAREQELLPVGYVHLVFTMPEPLARLALANKRPATSFPRKTCRSMVYDLLFRAAAATLLQVAANPTRLGATMGGLMVLHTWGNASSIIRTSTVSCPLAG